MGKINYVIGIISNYCNWYSILFNRIVNRPIKRVVLRDGTKIVGGNRSLTIDIVDEVFIRKVYNPEFLKINTNDVVLDVGANIGIYSLYASLNGAKSVYSIEPLVENIKYIKFNFKNNNLKYPKIANVAISRSIGVAKLSVSNYDSHNMLFEQSAKTKTIRYRLVNTINLAKFMKLNNINRVDFLKVDCEGSEGQIFSSMKPKTMEKINRIAIEYHNNVSSLSNIEISKILIDNGYKVKTIKSDNTFGYIYAWK